MNETQAMQRALELARRGQGYVEPNPMVGCVLLRGGSSVGEGFHERFGDVHAEVAALRNARQRGNDPAGATAVVTLEPCAHHGKQPPCVEALIGAGVSRVVAAMEDPDPRVAGQGFDTLRQTGIEVEVGIHEAQAHRLNAPFIKRTTTGLPWVIAKWAQTLDGKVATSTGDSKWISNKTSRKKVHELRARVDAIMVGVGTVIADDPALTAREVELKRVARRVVFDRTGRLERAFPQAKLLHDGGPPVTVWSGEPEAGLRQLADEGATNVLLEGGPTLTSAMFDAGLVDEAWVFVAPKVLGDASAKDALSGRTCASITEALSLHLEHAETLDGDLWLRYLVPQGR